MIRSNWIVKAGLLAGTALTTFAITSPAKALDWVQETGSIPGALYNMLSGMSGDGKVLIGMTDTQIWVWSNGVYTFPVGFGGFAAQFAANFDGSVIVGNADTGGGTFHGVMWTAGSAVPTDLHFGAAFDPGGTLNGYATSRADGVSGDGTVVTGSATNGGGIDQAYVWTQATGMVGIGTLPGYTDSFGKAISGNGKVVIGDAADPTTQAFRWSQAMGMTGLGFLNGGTVTYAHGVNHDGSVIVGHGDSSRSTGEAYRWTQATGLVSLGFVSGNTRSLATAVSADGSIVVGYSSGGGPTQAFRWTAVTGMRSIQSLLAESGVNLGGWQLWFAQGISADGSIIAGRGLNPATVTDDIWLVRCVSMFCQGLTTESELANSYSGQAAVGHTANAAIGGALTTMQEYATQARASQGSRSSPYSVFAYGAYDSDPVTSGTLGITVDLPDQMIAGFSVSAARVETEMVYDGSADMRGGGLSAFLARVPDTGLQWLVGVNGLLLDGDIERGYTNGVGRVYSKGETSSDGFGAIARVGWTEQFGALQLTPFASYTFSQTTLDAYTETDGVFTSSFEGMKSTAETARFGADARYTFKPDTWIWGTLAWGHRLDGGKGADVTATLVNWVPMSVPGVAATEDWLEVGGGVRLPAWDKGAITGSVTASIPEDEGDTTYLARVGLSQDF
ncbi:autotransporter domain-containing protein [Hyphomicrobium sp.]|uniref:autotransporter domain-containing protein n=1 Tax=Hyphomicrobium sp. TaxID=82 RepID=UPI003F7209FA